MKIATRAVFLAVLLLNFGTTPMALGQDCLDYRDQPLLEFLVETPEASASSAIAMRGSRAYLSGWENLEIWDLARPDKPIILAKVEGISLQGPLRFGGENSDS